MPFRALLRDKTMLAIIAAVLVILWLAGLLAFHVTSAVIHLLLVIAVVMIVLHFMRGRAAP